MNRKPTITPPHEQPMNRNVDLSTCKRGDILINSQGRTQVFDRYQPNLYKPGHEHATCQYIDESSNTYTIDGRYFPGEEYPLDIVEVIKIHTMPWRAKISQCKLIY